MSLNGYLMPKEIQSSFLSRRHRFTACMLHSGSSLLHKVHFAYIAVLAFSKVAPGGGNFLIASS